VRAVSRGNSLGEAEIEDLHRPLRGHHDVRRFQITVNDRLRMCRLESFGDLFEDLQRVVNLSRSAKTAFRQRLAAHQLHDQVAGVGRAFEAVNHGDIRVTQGGEQPRLTLEAGETFRMLGDFSRQHFDCNFPTERAVQGPIDLAHPAGAQQIDDFVRSQIRPAGKSHERSGL
jgi:hypothetical protein